MRLNICLSIFAFLLAALPGSAAPHSIAPKRIDFEHDVQPILKAICYQCHGPNDHEASLRLDIKSAAMQGGVSGKAIVPGNADKSLLVRRILGQDGLPQMPMGFAPLSPQRIALIKAWINQGAVWKAGPEKKHWAYIAPLLPALPKVKNSAWCRDPIDRFVLAKLQQNGLKPSRAANRAVLIRRVYLDLTGLPPSVPQVDAFVTDKRPDAYERVVDSCLKSPHFGERWARLWLDLARYADTNGYEKDLRRSIWPYRDWVINAFNQDMPFDEFTIDQLAGDMLPHPTVQQLVATGFQRNTLLNQEGGVDPAEQRWYTLVDRVNTTAGVWLGTTLQCAECHDHKYDPFTQKEYYKLLAFYDNQNEPTLQVPTPIQAADLKALKAQIAACTAAQTAQKQALQKQWDALQTEIPTTLIMQERPTKGPITTYIHVKGAFLVTAGKVTAGTPAVLNPLPPGEPADRLTLARWLMAPQNPLTARVAVNRFWETIFGRGIVATSDDFGTQGTPPSDQPLLDWLARTFEDSPSPAEPYACGWSVKKLLRIIVTSAAYRQSSRITPALLEKDPLNDLLARGPRFRMEGEMIRDTALSAAGLLSLKIGGPSVFPYQPDGIWQLPYNDDQWVTSTGLDRYRRALYTFWRRSAPYPSLVAFDATSREVTCLRRIRTTTPLQALVTLNDPAFFEAARGLARRMLREGGSETPDQITFGFRCCVARRPTPAELNRLLELYTQQLANYSKDLKSAAELAGGNIAQPRLPEIAALTIVSNVLLNMDATLTKE